MSDGLKSEPPLTPPVPADVVLWERVEKFVGQLSHDIRNGLNACELQLTFLGEISADPDAIEDIKRLRATLAGITRQLQSVRVSMSGATGHLMDYPAKDLVEDLRERVERTQPELAALVRWNLEISNAKLAHVDPELVLSSCLELLKNASHFVGKEGWITCAVRESDDHHQILISFEQPLTDEPTIPTAEWGKSPLLSTRRGAYGLGLFRARRALAACGCGLEFRWHSDRKALTATIVLPGATVLAPA